MHYDFWHDALFVLVKAERKALNTELAVALGYLTVQRRYPHKRLA